MSTDKPIAWDDVEWANTHLGATLGIYHLGRINHSEHGRCLALSVAHDDHVDSQNPSIILLNDDAVDELLSALRYEAKSL